MNVARFFDEMSYGPAPEADTEARAWLARHEARFGHFIGGHFVPPGSGAYFDTSDPATGKAGDGLPRPRRFRVRGGRTAGRPDAMLAPCKATRRSSSSANCIPHAGCPLEKAFC